MEREFYFIVNYDSAKIIDFLSSFRNVEGLIYYISLFKEDRDMRVIFEKFIIEASQETFSDERYNVTLNPHLAHIFEYNKVLGDHWRANFKDKEGRFFYLDTDNPEDLFLCGTEVDGSCQSVFAKAEHNKCLMGYVMNGQCRLLAVKNSKGRIVARAIIKLLWAKEQNEPVLFMEKVYPKNTGSAADKNAIRALAEKRATAMGLNLYTEADIIGREEEGMLLSSMESRAPFEYSDAARGVFDIKGYSFRVSCKA